MLITMFYSENENTFEKYIKYACDYTLKLDYPMVIYTEQKYKDLISKYRDPLNTIFRTDYNIKDYSYNNIINLKAIFIKDAIKNYPSSYYAWIDFGLSKNGYNYNDDIHYFKNVFKEVDKITFAIVLETRKNEDLIAAGLMLFPNNKLSIDFCESWYSTYLGTNKTEEQIIYNMYTENPELYNVYYSWYHKLICDFPF